MRNIFLIWVGMGLEIPFMIQIITNPFGFANHESLALLSLGIGVIGLFLIGFGVSKMILQPDNLFEDKK